MGPPSSFSEDIYLLRKRPPPPRPALLGPWGKITNLFLDPFPLWEKGRNENPKGRPRRLPPRHPDFEQKFEQEIQENILKNNLKPR